MFSAEPSDSVSKTAPNRPILEKEGDDAYDTNE